MAPGFTITSEAIRADAQRVGTLSSARNATIDTPAYIASSRRGQIPHLSPDNVQRHTKICCVYTAYEDYAENLPDLPSTNVFLHEGHVAPLHSFNAFPAQTFTILGPRRLPPVLSPKRNQQSSIGICTAVGYRDLPVALYYDSMETLRPDAFVVPLSLETARISMSAGPQHIAKVVERTHAWVSESLVRFQNEEIDSEAQSLVNLWIPMIPVPVEQQGEYLSFLSSSLGSLASGFVFHKSPEMSVVPPSLLHLPRMSIDASNRDPRYTLNLVEKGMDLITVPYVNSASDGGIALCFHFAESSTPCATAQRIPLAIDLRCAIYKAENSSIDEKCSCYACASYSCAYIHHLLMADEMLAWVLLQIHNYHLMDIFFEDIRSSIKTGQFITRKHVFDLSYDLELPEPSGTGPRRRGYQMNPQGASPSKANKAAYVKSLSAEHRCQQSHTRQPSSKAPISWLLDEDEYHLNFDC